MTGGFQYTASPKLKFDFGAAYLFIRKASININGSPASTAANALLNGHYDSNTVIISGQVNYAF